MWLQLKRLQEKNGGLEKRWIKAASSCWISLANASSQLGLLQVLKHNWGKYFLWWTLNLMDYSGNAVSIKAESPCNLNAFMVMYTLHISSYMTAFKEEDKISYFQSLLKWGFTIIWQVVIWTGKLRSKGRLRAQPWANPERGWYECTVHTQTCYKAHPTWAVRAWCLHRSSTIPKCPEAEAQHQQAGCFTATGVVLLPGSQGAFLGGSRGGMGLADTFMLDSDLHVRPQDWRKPIGWSLGLPGEGDECPLPQRSLQ